MRRTDYSDKGLWHATYGPYEPNQPLTGEVEADVAIIGGGFTGMATAYHLLKAEPSMKVVVMERDSNVAAWTHLEQHIAQVFPPLKGARIAHRWGGPFSVTADLTPALGYLGDKRAVYSLGCIGHGVAMTHLNGQTIRDLILERQTDLTDVFLVNRRLIPWPGEPARFGMSAVLRGYLQLEDWARERGMPRL